MISTFELAEALTTYERVWTIFWTIFLRSEALLETQFSLVPSSSPLVNTLSINASKKGLADESRFFNRRVFLTNAGNLAVDYLAARLAFEDLVMFL